VPSLVPYGSHRSASICTNLHWNGVNIRRRCGGMCAALRCPAAMRLVSWSSFAGGWRVEWAGWTALGSVRMTCAFRTL
jgi:hypothetical protein